MSKLSKPIPIALPNEMLDKIERVRQSTDLAKQDIMRLAMTIGLADLETINGNLAGVIREAAAERGKSFLDWLKSRPDLPQLPPSTEPNPNRIRNIATLNEPPASYGTPKKKP